jgi:flagellar biosynthesis protein FlhA
LLGERPQALLGPDEVRAILDGVRQRAAGLVETIHPNPLSLGAITRILRALLEDGVGIGHPLPILAALGQAVQQTTEHDRLIDIVRAELGPMIVGRVCSPHDRLPVITLDAALEAMIVQGMQDPVTGLPVIEPDLARGLGERIAALITARGPGAIPPALIVQPRAPIAMTPPTASAGFCRWCAGWRGTRTGRAAPGSRLMT